MESVLVLSSFFRTYTTASLETMTEIASTHRKDLIKIKTIQYDSKSGQYKHVFNTCRSMFFNNMGHMASTSGGKMIRRSKFNLNFTELIYVYIPGICSSL